MKRSLLTLPALLALASVVPAAAPAGADPTAPPAPISAQQRFDRLAALAGAWEMATGEGQPALTISYRVTAAGSAVMETLFAGTPKEMVTLYTVDGDDLVLTHYCAMKNQPHMKAAPSSDAGRLSFAFVSGGNMKSRDDMHMDSLAVTFTDDKHFHQDWTMWNAGKVVKTASFDWTKKAE